ncbi:MAG: phosphoribosylformylglycinamidine synthase subunit PurS [Synechococcales cyanobacterium]
MAGSLTSYRADVDIHLKPSVLDPAGVAVQKGLHHLGYPVDQVRIGKSIRLIVQAETAADAENQVQQMCDQLLANPVIETYTIRVVPL